VWEYSHHKRGDAESWIVPPVAVRYDLLGGGARLGLLIGYTRLGICWRYWIVRKSLIGRLAKVD
jgi:hypothetical protein